MEKIGLVQLISALLAPITAICSLLFMWQQKEIQEKQHKTELFKLRAEHTKFLFDTWGIFNTYIVYIPNYKAQIISNNGNQEIIISTMKRAFASLYEHNIATRVLYNKELEELENTFIESLQSLIPSSGMEWTIYNILEGYEQSKELFNQLYTKYQEILYKEGKIW